ncbi:Ent-kaurene oxidase 7 [Colletotrichum truncatum]|uniref:Ent-kaurene oxidase 7 n=1 Tax=Colletotrichum truncatum TaxID=5467 RepID=A0ACC3ZC70_COLTU|nr:Ent-kaurene oxidase 7 [Colletotrichum truncatum]KAF6797673.1 Ent-kaurene oxidase 7 [Colletotrichum truncatum]
MSNLSDTVNPAVAFDDQISKHLPAVTAGLVFIVFAWLAQSWFKVDPLANVPVVGGQGGAWKRRKEFAQGKGADYYIEGYRKFKDRVFRVTTLRKRDTVCVPTKYLPDLKKLPDDVLSFTKAIDESMQVKYTKVETDTPLIVHTVRASLTPALPRINELVADEVAESMRLELPQSQEWTEVNINSKLLRIVAMASGRVFIGPELCRDERYIDASINYTVDLMTAVHMVSFLPGPLRPFVAPFLPPLKKLNRRIAEAEAVFRPIVEARRQAKAEKGDDYQEPDDMLQWMMNAPAKFGEVDNRTMAQNQLGISFAAIHTTSLTTTNAFYWLAAKPELIPILRDDVQQALLESGGQFSSPALQNMKKLDSFLREVLRCSPLSAGSFQRKVLKSFKLPDGQIIPEDVVIEVPAGGMNLDDEIFPNAAEFDALRYYKLRMAKEEAESGAKAAEVVAQSQFVSVGASHLTFGYGRHACPGRFFAVNEIKMIMANILCNYEIKLPDGVTERYENLKFGASSMPDPSKTVMIRKI